jgi:hypothetical protein
MKKISLYITMFLTACLMACTEDFNENVVAPQSYPEEEPQVINGFAIALDGGFTSPVVLKDLEENALIQAVKATTTPEITEGASVTFRLQLSDTEDFTRVIDLPSQSGSNAAVVDASDLNEAVKELFGKAPNPRTIYLRTYVYILDGTSASQIPAPVILGTITVTPIPILQLYVPSDSQGWDPAAAPIVYNRNFDMRYEGYVYLENSFKFTSEPNWDGPNYGYGGDNGELSTSGGNLTVSEAGFYRLVVDLSGNPLTYTATKTEWGLIGNATAGGSFTPMTLDPATGEWTVTTTLTGGKEYKFCVKDNESINLGGNLSNLTYGGGNILVLTDGTYTVTLKLGNPKAYKATVVKQ